MKYNFYVSSMGGSLGWIRWRNTIPDSVLPAWMSRYGTFWGTLYWGDPVSEVAFQGLVKISQEMGLYGDPASGGSDQPAANLEHRGS